MIMRVFLVDLASASWLLMVRYLNEKVAVALTRVWASRFTLVPPHSFPFLIFPIFNLLLLCQL